jgi:hypothetical protein
MIGFAEVYAALNEGKHVRQRRWDKGSKMFVRDGELVYLCHGEETLATGDLLDWHDMNRKDWMILQQS